MIEVRHLTKRYGGHTAVSDLSFTIDKGSSSGIEPGDPVVTSEGIVGVCYDVAENTSGVRTLFSPKTAIGVYSLRTRYFSFASRRAKRSHPMMFWISSKKRIGVWSKSE